MKPGDDRGRRVTSNGPSGKDRSEGEIVQRGRGIVHTQPLNKGSSEALR